MQRLLLLLVCFLNTAATSKDNIYEEIAAEFEAAGPAEIHARDHHSCYGGLCVTPKGKRQLNHVCFLYKSTLGAYDKSKKFAVMTPTNSSGGAIGTTDPIFWDGVQIRTFLPSYQPMHMDWQQFSEAAEEDGSLVVTVARRKDQLRSAGGGAPYYAKLANGRLCHFSIIIKD